MYPLALLLNCALRPVSATKFNSHVCSLLCVDKSEKEEKRAAGNYVQR